MFPEDFFSSPNQYKTIQIPINKNREHPKLINPTIINKKVNQPLIPEIKEEKCEESIDNQKNKTTLKIVIPQNISNEEISTSGGSYNTPKAPNLPIRPVIRSEPKNKKNVSNINIKNKLIPNNCLNKNIQNNSNNNNNIKDENIDLYYPMAFTFNSKGKKSNTLNNSRSKNYKYHQAFENDKKNFQNKEKNINNRKSKNLSFQKREEKSKSENDKNKSINHNNNNKNNSFENKYKSQYNRSRSNIIKRNNSKAEDRKTLRNNCFPVNNRNIKSAKKSTETINILTINNNKNKLRRNTYDPQKDLNNKKNIKNFKSEYDIKKKEIVNLKVKNKINQILDKLPENYEKFPVLNNKFELLMKNLDDIKHVLDRKNMFARNKVNKK